MIADGRTTDGKLFKLAKMKNRIERVGHPSGCPFELIKNETLRAADYWELKTPGMSRFPRRQVTHATTVQLP